MTAPPSHLALISLPFEVTTSFLRGTAFAPQAILHDLEHLDDFELLIGNQPFRGVPRTVIEPFDHTLTDPELMQIITARVIAETLEKGGFPLCLGGEHTVSLGPLRACRDRGELGVVQLDAHGDLRDEQQGSKYGRSCVMRRATEFGCDVLGVGTRSLSASEAHFISGGGALNVDGRTAASSRDWWSLLDHLPERIYLSVDMGVFDPADIPSVSAPVVGGPSWYQITDFITHVFEVKHVVAADIVELMPHPADHASIRAASRLAGIITGLKFKK